MPQLGESVTEGTITKWLKKVGESINKDEPLFEVSTDKVDSEVPSNEQGVIAQILVEEGDTVDVGTVLAVISDGSEVSDRQKVVAEPEPVVEAVPTQTTAPREPSVASRVVAEPEPVEQAASELVRTASYANQESVTAVEGDREQVDVDHESLLLSPVVRKLVRENGIDAGQLTGTGVGGRITRSDVLDFIDRAKIGSEVSASFARPPARHEAPQIPSEVRQVTPERPVSVERRVDVVERQSAPAGHSQVRVGERDEVIPFNNIRRRTAEHMVRSKAISAHTLVSIEADFENVEQVRRKKREGFKQAEGFSLTYLPFISRAAIEAIKVLPRVNASVGDDELIVHRDINLAIAVDLDLDGLIAPVIHNADGKRMTQLAREISDLASRARSKQLSADEISGGTFTITNPGPFGTLLTYPIINQPQVAILSTDGIKRKPVVVVDSFGAESIAIHSVGVLAIAFDHRVVDGAYAAAFLAKMRDIIETWNWEQEF